MPHHTASSPSRKTTLCSGAVLLGVIAKGWLIAGSSISDAGDDPREYVRQILHRGIAYGPGTGWVGRCFYYLGVPFRWGIEALFILALLLLLRALFAWPTRSWLPAVLFLLLLFDPVAAFLFSNLMSDQVWLVETLLGLSLFVLAVEREEKPRWLLLGLGAVSLGLSAVTRSIFAPLVLDLAAFALLAALLLGLKPDHARWRKTAAVLALSLWSLALGIGIVYGGTCWYNARCYGFAGISALDSSEYKTFFLTLQSVGAPTGAPDFPIDENRRKLIAQAGPVCRWFIAELEKSDVQKKTGLAYYGKYDIPTGWLHFAVFHVVLRATHGDIRAAFALFRTMEQEIAVANRRGVLHTRLILPLPDSRLGVVAAQLPGALLRTARQIAWEPAPGWLKDKVEHASFTDPDFTRALTRQPISTSPAQEKAESLLVRLYAWLYGPCEVALLALLPAAFAATLALRRNLLTPFSPGFIARQSFALTFWIMMLWYALFDASGLPVLYRYTIYNHLLLPVLLAYYLTRLARLPFSSCSSDR